MQLQIDSIKWVLEIEVNKVPNDRLELWTKIETLQWVLYVIFALKNEIMVDYGPDCSTLRLCSFANQFAAAHFASSNFQFLPRDLSRLSFSMLKTCSKYPIFSN
jgi:hypothetical protein